MEDVKREPGFYWVINDAQAGWEVGQFTDSGNWMLTGSELTYSDGEMNDINELPILSHTQRSENDKFI